MSIWAKWIEQDHRFLFSLSENGGIELTSERHLELLEACSAGLLVVPGDDGVPQIREPLPPSIEILSERERSWRTAELARYEWLVTRHRDEAEMGTDASLSSGQFADLLLYRQVLRDWPSSENFPALEDRPTPPEWLLNLTQ